MDGLSDRYSAFSSTIKIRPFLCPKFFNSELTGNQFGETCYEKLSVIFYLWKVLTSKNICRQQYECKMCQHFLKKQPVAFMLLFPISEHQQKSIPYTTSFTLRNSASWVKTCSHRSKSREQNMQLLADFVVSILVSIILEFLFMRLIWAPENKLLQLNKFSKCANTLVFMSQCDKDDKATPITENRQIFCQVGVYGG